MFLKEISVLEIGGYSHESIGYVLHSVVSGCS
jgi:hypothetical protein